MAVPLGAKSRVIHSWTARDGSPVGTYLPEPNGLSSVSTGLVARRRFRRDAGNGLRLFIVPDQPAARRWGCVTFDGHGGRKRNACTEPQQALSLAGQRRNADHPANPRGLGIWMRFLRSVATGGRRDLVAGTATWLPVRRTRNCPFTTYRAEGAASCGSTWGDRRRSLDIQRVRRAAAMAALLGSHATAGAITAGEGPADVGRRKGREPDGGHQIGDEEESDYDTAQVRSPGSVASLPRHRCHASSFRLESPDYFLMTSRGAVMLDKSNRVRREGLHAVASG